VSASAAGCTPGNSGSGCMLERMRERVAVVAARKSVSTSVAWCRGRVCEGESEGERGGGGGEWASASGRDYHG
jgi:hypothetical protein